MFKIEENKDYPWMLIYNGTENGIEYLSQKDYEFFKAAALDKDPQILLKDGRILPTFGARVRPNPAWVDPAKVAEIKKIVDQRRAERMAKNDKK